MYDKKGFKFLRGVILSLLVLLYIICIYRIKLQNDTLFDIKLGEKYLSEGIVTEDNYSIHNDMKYVAQHLGVNIITYLVYNSLGFSGLYILGIILTSLLAVILYRLNLNFLNRKKLGYIFIFLELFFLQNFLSIRAQMYTYILFALEILLIEKFIKKKNILYLVILSIIPLIIINIHSGVIFFYFIILAVYFLNIMKVRLFKLEYDENVNKICMYLIIPFIIGLGLMFINPFGIDAITYGLKTLSNTFINGYVSEFQPFSIKISGGIIITIYLAVFILSFMFTKKKIKLHHFFLFFGTMFMTLLSVRHFSLLIICSVTCLEYIESIIDDVVNVIFYDMKEKGKKIIRRMVSIILFVFLLCICVTILRDKDKTFLPKDYYPLDAVDFIKENIGNDKRIFNEYTWGSILMMNDIKVFIDSRADLYTKEYSEKEDDIGLDYIRIINCAGNYIKLLEKYDIEYIFINKNSNLAKNILEHEEYEKIYQDNISCIIQKVK